MLCWDQDLAGTRPWAVGGEALRQNTHPMEVKWQNPSLSKCFSWCPWPGFSEGPGDVWSFSSAGWARCLRGFEQPCRVSLRSLCCCHTQPCSRVSHVSLPRWAWPCECCSSSGWCLSLRGTRGLPALPRGSVPQNLCTSQGPQRSAARWQCQLLVRTVAVPGSHHFRSQNEALTLSL